MNYRMIAFTISHICNTYVMTLKRENMHTSESPQIGKKKGIHKFY